MSRTIGTMVVLCGLLGAVPAQGKPSALQKLAAEHLGAPARDVQVLATAVPLARENAAGSAALVRVDDGSDGGIPKCHLLVLAGRPSSPARVDGDVRLPVCPIYNKGNTAQLTRVPLGSRRAAWQCKLDSQRVDTHAKGVETLGLWALVANPDGGRYDTVFERTSMTFRGKADKSADQAEKCEAPVVQGGSEPESLEIACDTETMLGSLAKKQRSVFKYVWTGSRFSAQ